MQILKLEKVQRNKPSEFKEIFYKQKRLEPDRKAVLEEQIDFIFKFEERMKEFIDQPLHSIGKLKQ